MINTKRLNFLKSIKFCILVLSLTIITFIFFDIPFFEFSKTFDISIFNFFKNFIDPLSDILDPFKIILLCLFIIFLNLNMNRIIKNEIKLRTLRSKTGFSSEKIKSSFSLINLICKHFIYSLAGAGILCNLLKYIAGVSRPKYFFNEGYDRINLFNFEHKVNSFPSGHTQAAFTLAILLIIYTNRFTLIILILISFLSGQDTLVLKNNRVYNGKITGDKLTIIEFKPKAESYLSLQTSKIRILKSNDKVIIISGMRIDDYLKLDLSSKCKIDASYGHKELDTDLSNILPANERLAYPAFYKEETKE